MNDTVNTEKLAVDEALKANMASESERLEAATDQAIATCGGDARATVKALLVANEFLEMQISRGYLRGVKHGRLETYIG